MRSLWCDRRPDPGPGRVGLMADSHGDSRAIGDAVAGLRARGCTLIIHLGDICDSADPSTAAACVARLSGPGILAVCGNNDHALVSDNPDTLDARTRTWIEGLPLSIETPSALFTHNRPFVDRMGVAALVGDLNQGEVLRFLHAFPGRLLFRGHSHQTLVSRLGPGGLEHLVPSNEEQLSVTGGAVITCGSLDRKTALVWATDMAVVYRVCL